MLIGFARVSTDAQDLTAQRDALADLGVAPDRIYVDHGPNRHQPRPTRSPPSPRRLPCRRHPRRHQARPARAIADELTAGQVKLNLGGSVHDPTDPVGRLLFNVLAMVAEFETDLARMRTRGDGSCSLRSDQNSGTR
jgi:DNA invertase Pin-like site-specific DNA recombinase